MNRLLNYPNAECTLCTHNKEDCLTCVKEKTKPVKRCREGLNPKPVGVIIKHAIYYPNSYRAYCDGCWDKTLEVERIYHLEPRKSDWQIINLQT